MKGLSIRYRNKGARVPYAGMEKKKDILTTADKLVLIAGKAGADRKLKFISLIHLLTKEYLYECYKELKRGKAAGIDGKTRESYTDEQMQEAIRELVYQRTKATAWIHATRTVCGRLCHWSTAQTGGRIDQGRIGKATHEIWIETLKGKDTDY